MKLYMSDNRYRLYPLRKYMQLALFCMEEMSDLARLFRGEVTIELLNSYMREWL